MTRAHTTHIVLVAGGAAIAAVAVALLGRRDRNAGRAVPIFGLRAAGLHEDVNTQIYGPRSAAPAEACCASCAAGRNANGRTVWRAPLVGDRRWAPWVRELDGKIGVYLIRPAGGGDVLYVGESHRGRLMKTMTRHLWQWSGRGSGPTYDPSRVEVAVELFDEPADAVERQFELIRQLEPVDNVQDGHSLVSPAAVPF